LGFFRLILANLLYRFVRTALTTVGLAIAISAVIILVGISWNFEKSFMQIYESKKIDLIVVHAGSSNQLSSSLDVSLEGPLRKVDGVADVAPTLVDTVAFEDHNLASVIVNGWKPDSLLFKGIRVLEGTSLKPRDGKKAMLGRVLALNVAKKTGDKLDISGETFDVVGVFESESLFDSGSVIMPLETLQKMMGREGQATGFVVTAKSSDGAYVRELGQRIERSLANVAATPARDYVVGDTQLRLVKAMTWTTAGIALALGAVGMLNTMLMSIFERTKEIGILRAVGWHRKRVLALVLGEALVLSIAGTILGSIMAVVGLRVVTLLPTARGFIDPNLPPAIVIAAILMGITLSLLGGLYPAARAAALDPIEALRHD
jgi:putative ABC transport system permease protein